MVNRTLAKDILERCLWTAAQAFLATWVITGVSDVTDASLFLNAMVAALAATLSTLKGLVASKVGQPTASLP